MTAHSSDLDVVYVGVIKYSNTYTTDISYITEYIDARDEWKTYPHEP